MTRLLTLSLILILFGAQVFAQQWQSFTIQNSGLPGNNVFAIDADEFGTMWFGTDRGITAYDGSARYTFIFPSKEPLTMLLKNSAFYHFFINKINIQAAKIITI